jgi:hypothetical protein
VNKYNGKQIPSQDIDDRPPNERRRIGHIVHDDRGSASVEWRDAPDDHERPVFEIEKSNGSDRGDSKLRRGFEPTLEVRDDDTFNPYDRKPDTFGGNPAANAKGGKRDLKKLSEWLKLMRAMEERKKNGEPEEG